MIFYLSDDKKLPSIWEQRLVLCLLPLLSPSQTSGVEKRPFFQQVTPPVILAEGPHWDVKKQVLYFVDIEGQSVQRYNPKDKRTTSTSLGGAVGVMVPVAGTEDQFVAGVGRDLVRVQWDGSSSQSRSTVIDSVEHDKSGNRFNDGKADARGRLWIGTIGYQDASGVREKEANLYRLSADTCKLQRVVPDITTSNGIAWSHDNKRMYYIDTDTYRVDVFDYDISTTSISNRRPVFDFKTHNLPGRPDGMTIDTDGNLWVAINRAARVVKINPRTRRLLLTVHLPVEYVTSVAFGGANLDVLYVTTSRRDLNATQLVEQPMAGSVIAITQLGAKGLPANSVVLSDECNAEGPYRDNSKTRFHKPTSRRENGW